MVSILRFRNGAVGYIVSSCVAPGEDAGLSILSEDQELRITEAGLHLTQPGRRTYVEHERPGLPAAHEAFLQAVKSGDKSLVRSDYGDAVFTLRAALAAVESAQTGKVVNL